MTSTSEEFANRVLGSVLGGLEIYSMHIGDRLGFYEELSDGEPRTTEELAAACGTNDRYTREWLEQQAANGIVMLDRSTGTDRFSLPEGHADVLANSLNSFYLAPIARMLTTAGGAMPLLLDAYKTGSGVSWARFGQDMREGQADQNRPFFFNDMPDVLAGLPDLHERLSRPGTRVADVGCGGGWATLALADMYPGASVHGYDIDVPSIEMARKNAAEVGAGPSTTFTAIDVGELAGADYDVVFAFECIHDMPRPVDVLRSMREMAGSDGIVIVMDEAVGDAFNGEGDEIERLMYGYSILVCLPDGMSSQPSSATGTVMRPSVLAEYATDAGFASVHTLTEAGFFRFYQLVADEG